MGGFSELVRDELVARDDPDSLDSLVSLAIKLDNRLREGRRQRATHQPPMSPSRATPFLKAAPAPDGPFPCFLSPTTKRADLPVTVGVPVSRVSLFQSPCPRTQSMATLC